MTENEIREFVQSLRNRVETFVNSGWAIDGLINDYTKSAETIEKMFEEIQQYREIGTVEELKSLKGSNLTALEMADIWCLLEDLKKYSAIGTIEEFKVLKKNQRKCEDCAGCTSWKCDCANERDYAINEFANFLHEKAKENNGLRLSSETRSWTHPCIFDYLKEFKNDQICKEET